MAARVERSLYEPARGFYETGGRAGRRGSSFLTSPEVGPLFGAVVARAIDAWWDAAGRPDRWVVVDAGAGPGTLARSILRAAPACRDALTLVSVERTAAQRAHHLDAPGAVSAETLPAEADVVVANELLDNLAFDLLERTESGWEPVAVEPDGTTAPDGAGPRIPVVARAAAWIDDTRARLRPGGRLVCLDYADTTAGLAARPWTDWVRAFAGHERLGDPFADPGSRDITVVVPWDQLPRPDRSTDQASWLVEHGIDALVAEGEREWAERAAAPDVRALEMRSRAAEAAALRDPDGLGAFWVGEWGPAGAGGP